MIRLILILLGVFTAAYCGLILIYWYWLLKSTIFKPLHSLSPRTFFSIIIPARNEADNIIHCLQSIKAQNYPTSLFEILVVNDHSTDDTALLVEQFSQQFKEVVLINLADHLGGQVINAYKKRAIEIAASQSKGSWIITTDADCIVPPNWLKLFDAYIQEKNPILIAAPVMFTKNNSLIGIFQLLDFISLQGITAAAVAAGYHSMCNGANLAYEKNAFYAVGQFKGIDHLASGDDMLLMHKIKMHYPKRLGYLFSDQMIVQTAPMPDWNSFLQQRIRWASKAGSYAEKSIFWVLALVYFFNVFLMLSFAVSFFVDGLWVGVLYSVVAKTLIELMFMIPITRFFALERSLIYFPFMQPMHVLYTVLAGWLGKFGKYQWKNRKVD